MIAGYTGCPGAPTPWSGRAMVSWPEASDAVDARRYWSHGPSLALIRSGDDGIKDRLIASFDDASGIYTYSDGLGGVVNPCNVCNATGVAFSDDFGASWHRSNRHLPSLPPPTSLLGGTQLASTYDGVVSISFGRRDDPNILPPVGSPRLVVAHRTTNGTTWSAPTVVAELANAEVLGALSLAAVEQTVLAAWTVEEVESRRWSVWQATSDDGGRSWSTPQELALSAAAADPPYAIVRLATPVLAYIATSSFADADQPRTLAVDALVRRGLGVNAWASSPRTRLTYRIDTRVWIRPPTSDVDQGDYWRDARGFSFDLGAVDPVNGGATLHLAFRDDTETGSSLVNYSTCEERSWTGAACADASAWHQRTFRPPSFGTIGTRPRATNQYQPVVSANRANGDVSLAWYQDVGALPNEVATHVYELRGARSVGAQGVFSLMKADTRWAPCPAAGSHSYGDQIASMIFPDLHASDSIPAIVTAYVTSIGGCAPQRDYPLTPTFDQHVESYRWPQ